MTHYLVSFSIYTLAMVGIIFAALFIFKYLSSGRAFSKKSTFLQVEDSMSLSSRKNVYVIKAGGERFLVASDVDRTSLIAKLDGGSQPIQKNVREDRNFDLNTLDNIGGFDDFLEKDDFAAVIDFQKGQPTKGPMMRELAKKLSAM